MNRKLAGVVLVVLVVATAVWFFALRAKGGGTPAARPTPTAPVAAGSGSAAAPTTDQVPAGMAPRWVRDADKPGTLQLEGQVLDEGGDPVGGAIVTLSSVPQRTATTEADGGFAFDKLVGREYALSAVAGARVGGPISHRLTTSSDPAVIRLVQGAKLVVTVVDGSDAPVPKATVKLIAMTETTATTGADGIATLEPVHPGWASVEASAPGFAAGHGLTQIGGAGGSGQIKITLRTGFAVSGRVVDDKGKPIAGAQVVTAGMWDFSGRGDRAETDAKGVFRVAALPPGTHTLVASDGVHAPARSAAITIENKPLDGIEIVMQAGGSISGRVLDAAKVPVVHATVRVGGDGQQSHQVSRMASTDKDGYFALEGLDRVALKIRAESDTAASEVVAVDLTAQPEKKGLELVLTVSGAISGTVVDETGAPIAEVQVNAFPDILGGSTQDALVLAGMSSATTDGGGQFKISGLPTGEYRLSAARSSQGRYDWGRQGVQAKTGDTNVKITLAAPGSLTGKLALEDGKAPSLANVQLGYRANEPAKPDGTFALTDVEPGTYDIYVRGPEFAEHVKKDVTVATGKPTDVGTLTLVRGRKVTGRVVDGGGSPIAGARVKSGDMMYSMQGAEDQMEQFEEMAGMKTATSDRDGRFTLVGIAKKAINVLADHPTKGRSSAIEIPAGTDDPPPLTLTLRGFGQIVGKVTSQGKPIGGATVTASPKGGGSQIQVAQSEADGSFTLTKVSEGTIVLSAMEQSAMGMSLKSTSVEVTIAAGKQTKQNIDIPVGTITLTVEVKPLPNNKVDSAQIFLMRGVIAVKSAKELNEAFLGGNAAGMKFWFGAGKPMPEFAELVPGGYSVCTIPITGDLNDTTFQQRLQQSLDSLAIYCKQAQVTPAPTKQTFVHDVPAMTPLPG